LREYFNSQNVINYLANKKSFQKVIKYNFNTQANGHLYK